MSANFFVAVHDRRAYPSDMPSTHAAPRTRHAHTLCHSVRELIPGPPLVCFSPCTLFALCSPSASHRMALCHSVACFPLDCGFPLKHVYSHLPCFLSRVHSLVVFTFLFFSLFFFSPFFFFYFPRFLVGALILDRDVARGTSLAWWSKGTEQRLFEPCTPRSCCRTW